MTPSILVAVPTFRRPEGLRALLDAMPAAIEGTGFTARLLVLDNEPAEATKSVVTGFADTVKFAVEYARVSEPGIAAVRNEALRRLEGFDYLAFLDDDEIPPAGWLSALFDGLRRHHADVVAAPVSVVAPADAPSWLREPAVWMFDQPRMEEGTLMEWCATNNTLLARRVRDLVPGGFDPRYSATGGSDTHFFYRASLAGAQIVWLERPAVSETMPPERARFRWLVRRAYRGGNVRGRVDRDLSGLGIRTAVRTLKGLLSVLAGALLAIAGSVSCSRSRAARGVLRVAGGIGTLSGALGAVYTEYRR